MDNPLFENEACIQQSIAHIKYEQQIAELKMQLEFHKRMSQQLQEITLTAATPIAHAPPDKRKYTFSVDTVQMREFIKENICNPQFVEDLQNGVALKDAKALPPSLVREYIAYRYKTEHSKGAAAAT